VGYGEGIVHVRDVQTAALPYYYRYNLTGAYPYRLVVRINTTEKKISQANGWIYINVTYSGYLKLYLGDKLVAYDALYGWTISGNTSPRPRRSSVSETAKTGRASRRRSGSRKAWSTETSKRAKTATR
jgi:hypothetical protein